jgi:hypothetical protein
MTIDELRKVYNVDDLVFCQAYIIELEKRIAELEAAQRWIPVEERLPVGDKCSEPVHAWTTDLQGKYGSISECVYVPVSWTVEDWSYEKGWYFRNQGKPMIDYIVTHWLPLLPGP